MSLYCRCHSCCPLPLIADSHYYHLLQAMNATAAVKRLKERVGRAGTGVEGAAEKLEQDGEWEHTWKCCPTSGLVHHSLPLLILLHGEPDLAHSHRLLTSGLRSHIEIQGNYYRINIIQGLSMGSRFKRIEPPSH